MYIKVDVCPNSDSWNSTPPDIEIGIYNEEGLVYLTLDNGRELELSQEDLKRIVKLFDV